VRLRLTQAAGFEVEGLPFCIDAGRIQPLGIITHAHTDHASRHGSIVCTPETALLLGERWKRLTVRAVPYEQTINLEGARVTLLPAGHILGSAMVLIETGDTRILFTGDFNTRSSPLHAPAGPVHCDVLVMESTFSRPEFVFPDVERNRQMMRAFVDAARASGYTPVLTGYAVGKAQQIVKLLAGYHETIWVHPKIDAFCDIYRRAGIELPETRVPAAGAPPGGLVVMPPNFTRTEWRQRISKPRVCFCSGWALDRGRGSFHRSDQIIPFSDHADARGLAEFAQATCAGKVYTMHGSAPELAEILRGEGLDAQPAPDHWQALRVAEAVQYSAQTLDLFDS